MLMSNCVTRSRLQSHVDCLLKRHVDCCTWSGALCNGQVTEEEDLLESKATVISSLQANSLACQYTG